MMIPLYMVSCTSFIPAKTPEQAVFCNHLKSNVERYTWTNVYIYIVQNWARSGPVLDIYKIGLAELSFYELNNHNLRDGRSGTDYPSGE